MIALKKPWLIFCWRKYTWAQRPVMKRMTLVVVQAFLVLVLALLLTKWLVALGLMGWLLQTQTGLDMYVSAANALGMIGGEDGEFMLLVVMVSVMLVPSALLVRGAVETLRKLRAAR
ncbi:hypothetical protein EGU77_20825 [Pseudomonas syringae pv. theae]|nr:hypothetical protein [Pseudomonas syringae pv. theae]MBL3836624.1 hypothetical protein [Pseudomonas syringae pv. theae]MBL3868971.1 hypothetical protein [Pseudomonas syringae pv. theae]GKQ48831.1 hypothetical protein PSTH2693_26765 [Pseudomonas syringae pv. theae]